MSIEHRHLSWIIIPMFLAGVPCKTTSTFLPLKVEYQQQQICAVKGSSVVFPCSFNYTGPEGVKNIMWGHGKSKRFVSEINSREVTSRFKYIGDRHHNCSLQIDQVEQNDSGKYSVRIFLGRGKGFGPREGRPTLEVVDLNISINKPNGGGKTKEDDSVNLTCISACDGSNTSSTFTWFKDGELLNEGSVLHLSNMSITNSGNYTCSLKTQPGTASRVINIDVEHVPKNTSVLVRPSMEVYTGSNFTLICSSHANPPVKNYSWFKKGDTQNYFVVGHQSVLLSAEGGQYFCRAINEHGSQNSSVVSLMIKATWATFTRDVLIITNVIVLLIVTTVIAVIRKRAWDQKMDHAKAVQDTEYVNWLSCDNHQSQEGSCPEEGTELIYATVDFSNRETNMGQEMGTFNMDEDVIYTTVCRHQLLNTWYVEPS
ncbi:sialic acid-binding Ig-like lectin 14 [Notolabrus celidotus]|uniref:sialic acid-binding Ig-like lectin 14 n=1 Tax=Notolabrus celidotus TaxID=1203425 RepID=UPI00148FB2F5|nr:sialic acid-binding Ig-like lectin 14 [Notolabrus celidotus]